MKIRPKIYHRASKVDQHGNVSALCYVQPRAIRLSSASWTIRDDAVTCPRCKALLAQIASVKAKETPHA